jgi:hypothetical protein
MVMATLHICSRLRVMSFHALFVVVLLLLLQHSNKVASAKKFHELDFVVPLTDETFEHETQASTGQTTGTIRYTLIARFIVISSTGGHLCAFAAPLIMVLYSNSFI